MHCASDSKRHANPKHFGIFLEESLRKSGKCFVRKVSRFSLDKTINAAMRLVERKDPITPSNLFALARAHKAFP